MVVDDRGRQSVYNKNKNNLKLSPVGYRCTVLVIKNLRTMRKIDCVDPANVQMTHNPALFIM